MHPTDFGAALRLGRVAIGLALATIVFPLAGCDGGNDDGSFRDDPTPFVSQLDERYAAILDQCARDAASPSTCPPASGSKNATAFRIAALVPANQPPE